jgi:hypothetical protein
MILVELSKYGNIWKTTLMKTLRTKISYICIEAYIIEECLPT